MRAATAILATYSKMDQPPQIIVFALTLNPFALQQNSKEANMRSLPLVVIGAGAAGLVVAVGATKAGKKALLIEKGTYGGDCTNFGCIPSKSLIASAEAAYSFRQSKELGIDHSSHDFNADRALARVRKIVDAVKATEDELALAKKGLETLTGEASLVGPNTIKVNDEVIHADQVVLATGSSPHIPSVEGLTETPFLTNETLFDLKTIPKSLCVIGGGPIGCELAHAFLRLGANVSIIHAHSRLLNREDPLAQDAIQTQFEKEGMKTYLGKKPTRIAFQDNTFHITLNDGTSIEAEKLLVSTGRRPNLSSLNLNAALVDFTEKGVVVDSYGRTSQKHIWAIGDIIGAPFFTHAAENQARTVLKNILLPSFFKIKQDRAQPIPRVTFTDPEIASIGLSEAEATKLYSIATYIVPFSAVDRAVTASREEGFVKIVTKKWSSKILGCTVVGPRAGEMLGQISMAMHANVPLRKLATLIHPYPTYNQAFRKAADLWFTQTILPALRALWPRKTK